MAKNPPSSLTAKEARVARRAQDEKIAEYWKRDSVREQVLLPAAGLNQGRGRNRSPHPEPTTLEHILAIDRAIDVFNELREIGVQSIALGTESRT